MLSIVVPCHNEEEGIELFYREVTRVADESLPHEVGIELLFVDDGSCDETLAVVRRLAQSDPRVRYLSFSRNFGKEAAIYAGMAHAAGDLVAVMDADLQDPPSLLPRLVEAVAPSDGSVPSVDIARVRRISREGEPPLRSLCARAFYRLMNLMADVEVRDGARDYQVMSRRVVDGILSLGEYNRFFKGLSSWVGYRVAWFDYANRERAAGESKWGFWSLARYAVDGIVAFSTKPLTLAAGAGIVCCLMAALLVIFVVVRTLLFGDPVAGWPSLVCVILLVGGLQLLCTGILGQYLAKTYLETKRRPLYLVEESSEDGRPSPTTPDATAVGGAR